MFGRAGDGPAPVLLLVPEAGTDAHVPVVSATHSSGLSPPCMLLFPKEQLTCLPLPACFPPVILTVSPLQYRVTVPLMGAVSDLCDALSRLSGIAAENVRPGDQRDSFFRGWVVVAVQHNHALSSGCPGAILAPEKHHRFSFCFWVTLIMVCGKG